MIWLTWRQHRTAILCAVAALVLYALCVALGANYTGSSRTFLSIQSLAKSLTETWPFLAGMVIATFVGAPLLAREREQRTYYLTWTQSVSRTRWLVVRLGLMIVGVIALGLLGECIATWHFGLPTAPNSAMSMAYTSIYMNTIWARFMTTGPLAVTLVLFSLMLGVTVSSFVKRTIGAMALTFVLFLVCTIGVYNIFPYLMPTQVAYIGLPGANSFETPLPNNAMQVRLYTLNEKGQEVKPACLADTQGSGDANCSSKFITKIVYQPAENFVPLQWLTSGLLFALSIILAIVVYFRVRSFTE